MLISSWSGFGRLGRGLSCWTLLSGSLLKDLDLANSQGGEREKGELERRFQSERIVRGLKRSLLGRGGEGVPI